MAGEFNRALRTHYNELATQVQITHGSRCPCCGHPMVNPRKSNTANQKRRDRMTVAHNVPVGRGGNDTIWVYACNGCNNDQGQLTFRQWSLALKFKEDRRAPLVAALADIVETYLREKSRARYSSVRFADCVA